MLSRYYVTMAVVSHLLLVLTVICFLNHQAASEVTYTIAADHDLCTVSRLCLSLSQFAVNPNSYLHSNTTLVFLPGIHNLTIGLTVSSVQYFSMLAETSGVQMVCMGTLFHFTHSQRIDIIGIEFVGCASNQIEHVAEFVLGNTIFRSGSTMSGGVLYSVMSNITIAASTFHSNVASWQGGVVRARNSFIAINACKFDSNTAMSGGGGVLYLLYSSAKIRGSDFNNSRTDFSGGVVYSQSSTIEMDMCEVYNSTGLYGGVMLTLHSSVTIKGSKFHCNFATTRGGILDTHNSNVTIQASEFNMNSATNGGVLYSRGGSNVTVDKSLFSNNTASSSGGVLYSSDSNVTIRECQFYNNNMAKFGSGLYSSSSLITIRGTSLFDNITAAYREGVLNSSNSIITIELRLNISDDDVTAATEGRTLDSSSASNEVNPTVSTSTTSMKGLQTTGFDVATHIIVNDSLFTRLSSTWIGVTTKTVITTEVETSKLISY